MGGKAVISYGQVGYAVNGIEIRNNGNATLNRVEFTDCQHNGIYNYKGTLSAYGCSFEDIGLRGVWADGAVSVIDSCMFDGCQRYGITIAGHPSAPYDSTKITRCRITRSAPTLPDSSQYAIFAGSIDKIRIDRNYLADYGQGGLYLTSAPGKVKADTIVNQPYYGNYANSSSDAAIESCYIMDITKDYGKGINAYNSAPVVRRCQFKSVDIGVEDNNSCPDLGRGTSYGYNDFEGCTSYYIRHLFPPRPLLPCLLLAVGNFYGSSGPDTNKFYGRSAIAYTPWLTIDPFPKQGSPLLENLAFSLSPAFPNPFNPSTTIKFTLPEPGFTSVAIYNILGQKIATIVNGYLQSGEHTYTWDGRNQLNEPVSSGLYICRIESGQFTESRKMTLLR